MHVVIHVCSLTQARKDTIMIDRPKPSPKSGALLAMVGAGISILAFLLLPYLTLSITPSDINNGNYEYTASISLNTGVISLFSGMIWLEAIFSAIVFGVAVLLLLREMPFGNTKTSMLMQIRQGAYALQVLSIVAAIFQYLFVSMANSQIDTFLQTPLLNIPSALNTNGSSLSIASILGQSNLMLTITVGYGFGSWCYLAGALLTFIGGIMIINATGQPVPNPNIIRNTMSSPVTPMS